jgi:hypothetical protein
MAGLMRREPHGEAADVFSRFDRLFDEWVRMMPFRPPALPRWLEAGDLIRLEEYREDGTLVVRADLPGIDRLHRNMSPNTFGIRAFNAISGPADVINQDHSPWYVRYWSHRIRALKNGRALDCHDCRRGNTAS